jgi:CelD/BcsL family acetyltransferase involved in cellulose biosynthesis
VMYINNAPCAFLIGQLYSETFFCHHAGYDPTFAPFSAGSLLTAWAFEDLAASGVREVDLGEGRQEHNRRLGCRVQEEGTVHVYLPTLRGIRLNIFFALTQTVRTAGRKTITELRLNRLRRAWSEFLISRWRARNRTGDVCS